MANVIRQLSVLPGGDLPQVGFQSRGHMYLDVVVALGHWSSFNAPQRERLGGLWPLPGRKNPGEKQPGVKPTSTLGRRRTDAGERRKSRGINVRAQPLSRDHAVSQLLEVDSPSNWASLPK